MSLITRSLDAFAFSQLKNKLHHILEVTDQTFRGFIIGQLTDALIIGIITFICSSLFGFPYPILLGFLAGVTNVIPVIGPFIGAVPCVLIILMVEPTKAIWYIILCNDPSPHLYCYKVKSRTHTHDGYQEMPHQ